MKTVYPKYTQKFKCIASKCPDTCCALWEIVIDKKFQNIYMQSPSPAAKKAVQAMYTDSDGDVCLRLNGGRCPMLNEDNLCELYIDMGKDALCDVCRLYPRFNKEFEDITFGGISLSCPESARLILSDSSKGELDLYPDFKDDTSRLIFDVYMFLTSMAKNGEFFDLLSMCENIQDEMDFGDSTAARDAMILSSANKCIPHTDEIAAILNKINDMECLTDEWSKLVKGLTNHLDKTATDEAYRKKRDAAFLEASQTNEIKSIQIYYLYKYLAEALDDADILSLYKRSRVCSYLICELYAMEMVKCLQFNFERKLRLAQLFSKEIEHNEDNLEKILDY